MKASRCTDSIVAIGIALASWALVPSVAEAQLPDFPTLSGAGLEYVSESGLFQITWSRSSSTRQGRA